jgi:heme A synthase
MSNDIRYLLKSLSPLLLFILYRLSTEHWIPALIVLFAWILTQYDLRTKKFRRFSLLIYILCSLAVLGLPLAKSMNHADCDTNCETSIYQNDHDLLYVYPVYISAIPMVFSCVVFLFLIGRAELKPKKLIN